MPNDASALVPAIHLPEVAGLLDACETAEEAMRGLLRRGILDEPRVAPAAFEALLDGAAPFRLDVGWSGQRLRGYDLLHRIAGRSRSDGTPAPVEVYLARDRTTDARVAVKVARSVGVVGWLCFDQEAQLCALARHPGVIRCLDQGETAEGSPYLVHAWVPGGSLFRWQDDPPRGRDLIELLCGLLGAVAHLHDVGVVHADLKPANVLLDMEGRPVLCDLGAAAQWRVLGRSARIGTPDYLAPELHGARVPTPASDLYGVGAIAYELVCGRSMYLRPSLEALLAAHRGAPVPPVVNRPGEDLPRGLSAWITRLLQKDPAERFATADLALRALRDTTP